MSPHLKWGLIMGGVVALLNLIGAALIGIINNFLSILTVAIAATMAGYYCAWQEPLEQRVKAGGIAGTIVGVINLISQLAGGVISWLISMESLVSFYSSHMSSNSPSITEGVRTSLEITVILAIVVGIILIFGAAGIGALAAKLSAPKIETKRN